MKQDLILGFLFHLSCSFYKYRYVSRKPLQRLSLLWLENWYALKPLKAFNPVP